MKKRFMNVAVNAAAMMAAVVVTVGSGLTAEAHALDDSAFTQIEGTMMYVSAGASVNAQDHIAEYCTIPQNILVKLTADQCKIYIETSAEEGGYLPIDGQPDGRAVGMYHGNAYTVKHDNWKEITSYRWRNYIDVLSDYDQDEHEIIFHEVGHYVDDNAFGGWRENAQYQVASSTQEWQDLYAANAAVIGGLSRQSSGNVYSACECFATSFYWYLHDPQTLLAASPAVYAYIEQVVASF